MYIVVDSGSGHSISGLVDEQDMQTLRLRIERDEMLVLRDPTTGKESLVNGRAFSIVQRDE